MTGIPLNRVVAFVGPYVSAIAGGIASWMVARVNVAGLPGLDQNNLKTGIAGALTWLLVSGLTWAGHSKWLTGHQIAMEADARVNAAAMGLAVAAPAAVVVSGAPEPGRRRATGTGTATATGMSPTPRRRSTRGRHHGRRHRAGRRRRPGAAVR